MIKVNIFNFFGKIAFIILVIMNVGLYASFSSAITGKFLHISSLKQQVLDDDRLIFDGEVEAIIDKKLHLCADKVEVDRGKQHVIAKKQDMGPVKLETNDFIILADYIFLNLENKTGQADNIRIHVDEGYFAAKKAEKIDESTWKLEDIIYTACDEPSPHWKFHADKATIRSNYIVRVKNPVFKIGSIPIFYVPSMVCPIQGRSKSGFLLPKFSWDYYWGCGINLQYYRYFGQHMDTTVGLDWKDRLGVIFSDEFRWGRSPDSYTQAVAQYAIANNAYVLHNNRIVKTTDNRYWVQGKDFGTLGHFSGMSVRSLIRADFGTDKRIGYHFFNNTDEVDDTFYNSVILRAFSSQNFLEIRGDSDDTCRKSFYCMDDDELKFIKKWKITDDFKRSKNGVIEKKKELDDKLDVTKFPHIESVIAYKIFKKFLFYRHDFFVDQVWYRQSETERIYLNSSLVKQRRTMPLEKDDVFRLGYRGSLSSNFNVYHNNIKFFVEPELQYRSDVLKNFVSHKNVLEGNFLGNGQYRVFGKFGAEWSLPEFDKYNEDFSFSYFAQPVFSWNFLPKFYQNNWYYIDYWDRAYPMNEIAMSLRNNATWKDINIDFDVEQRVDFYDKYDIFCLRRGVSSKHILPLTCNFSFGYDVFRAWMEHDIEYEHCKLLQSQIGVGFFKNKLGISASYLFQNTNMQKSRDLLSNIPHFVLLNFAVPLNKEATLFYEGQFYGEDNSRFASIGRIKPLIHRVKFDYSGHCWGFYIGFEQKKYREYGNNRTEDAIIFALRLDSLGSFAKKIRPPQIIHRE